MATREDKAKGVASQEVGRPQGGDSLSPDLVREVYGLVSRVIKACNVDEIAGECGVDRSLIWKWAKKPGKVYVGALPVLAENDPDPDGLARVAGALLALIATRAIARQVQGRTRLVIEDFAPGRRIVNRERS